MKNLTSKEYWDSNYRGFTSVADTARLALPNPAEHEILQLLIANLNTAQSVLEIGAGNSSILCHLALRRSVGIRYAGLDYSEKGCSSLSAKAIKEKLPIDVICGDMFSMNSVQQQEAYDFVYSLGVAEHFEDLKEVVRAKAALLRPGGVMVTVIPNMAGIIGTITRRLNPEVYDMHIPHELKSLARGHADAGLVIKSAGFLCSTNFGVLSSCFKDERGGGWTLYKWLSRLSAIIWRLEKVGMYIPRTAWLSPYQYVIAEKRGAIANSRRS